MIREEVITYLASIPYLIPILDLSINLLLFIHEPLLVLVNRSFLKHDISSLLDKRRLLSFGILEPIHELARGRKHTV